MFTKHFPMLRYKLWFVFRPVLLCSWVEFYQVSLFSSLYILEYYMIHCLITFVTYICMYVCTYVRMYVCILLQPYAVAATAASVQRNASGWTVQRSNPGAGRESPYRPHHGAHPDSCTMGTELVWGVKPPECSDDHGLLAPRLRMSGSIFLSPRWACRGISWSGLYLDLTLWSTTETSAKKQVNATTCLENDKQSGDTWNQPVTKYHCWMVHYLGG